MRKELRARGIKNLKVVYSKEIPIVPFESDEDSGKDRHQEKNYFFFVPSVAGLIMAGAVIRDLVEGLLKFGSDSSLPLNLYACQKHIRAKEIMKWKYTVLICLVATVLSGITGCSNTTATNINAGMDTIDIMDYETHLASFEKAIVTGEDRRLIVVRTKH